MLSLLWAAQAFGAEAPSTSSAFWAGSRWVLAIEETTPSPVELSAEENFSFRTRALQAEAVLSCPTAAPAGKQIDLDCTIEDFALRATPRTLNPSEALNPGNQRVLDSIVARLRGEQVLMRVSEDGRVLTVDLPGVVAGNRRESESRETLRRIVFDLVAGLHLRHADGWQSGWQEKNSALLRAPTQPGSSGLSQVRHSVTQVDGSTIVQSEGKGTFTSPYEPWEFAYDGRLTTRGKSSAPSSSSGTPSIATGAETLQSPSRIDDGKLVGVGPSAAASTPTDYTFTGTLSSIAVVDPAVGLPIERVWATLGRPNASSVGNMMGWSVFYSGKLRRLASAEQPTLGPTLIVAPPGQQLDGIGVWEPLTAL